MGLLLINSTPTWFWSKSLKTFCSKSECFLLFVFLTLLFFYIHLTLKYKKYALFPVLGKVKCCLDARFPREMRCKTSRRETVSVRSKRKIRDRTWRGLKKMNLKNLMRVVSMKTLSNEFSLCFRQKRAGHHMSSPQKHQTLCTTTEILHKVIIIIIINPFAQV